MNAGPNIPRESLGVADAERMLREQVAKKGADYVYHGPDGTKGPDMPACLNLHPAKDGDGWEPGCIVGHVFWDLGYTPDEFWSTGSAYGTNVDFGKPFDEAAVNLLSIVQYMQDCGTPWGEAVEDGVKTAAERRGEAPAA